MNIKKRYSDNVNYNLNRENLTSILECSNVFNLSLSQSRWSNFLNPKTCRKLICLNKIEKISFKFFYIKWKHKLKFSHVRCSKNRPFAGFGHRVQNKLHWDANDAVGLSKQRNCLPVQPDFPLFWKSHCVICVPVYFIPYHVTESCKGPITIKKHPNSWMFFLS